MNYKLTNVYEVQKRYANLINIFRPQIAKLILRQNSYFMPSDPCELPGIRTLPWLSSQITLPFRETGSGDNSITTKLLVKCLELGQHYEVHIINLKILTLVGIKSRVTTLPTLSWRHSKFLCSFSMQEVGAELLFVATESSVLCKRLYFENRVSGTEI